MKSTYTCPKIVLINDAQIVSESNMGNTWTRAWVDGPEITPKADSKPTFDPMLGFENGRKPRVLRASAEVSINSTLDVATV